MIRVFSSQHVDYDRKIKISFFLKSNHFNFKFHAFTLELFFEFNDFDLPTLHLLKSDCVCEFMHTLSTQ